MNSVETPVMFILLIIFVFIVVIILALAFFIFIRKKSAPPHTPGQNVTGAISPPAATSAKRCPRCQSTYTDPTLSFCLSDGTPLESSGGDEFETVVKKR
ncbi:MAG TPA: hypothetical protein VGC76_00195 [Pyrinomonadaceae bacterium]|jgi:hypothetical protein